MALGWSIDIIIIIIIMSIGIISMVGLTYKKKKILLAKQGLNDNLINKVSR